MSGRLPRSHPRAACPNTSPARQTPLCACRPPCLRHLPCALQPSAPCLPAGPGQRGRRRAPSTESAHVTRATWWRSGPGGSSGTWPVLADHLRRASTVPVAGEWARFMTSPCAQWSRCGRRWLRTAARPFPAWSACAAASVPATDLSLRSLRTATDLFPAAGFGGRLRRRCLLLPAGKTSWPAGQPVCGPLLRSADT